VDRFILHDGAPLRLRPARRREARSLGGRLADEGFDLAVIFLGDDYAPMITRAGVPHRVFVRETAYASLATATYRIGAPQSWGPSERLDAWRALGLDPPGGDARIRPLPEASTSIQVRLAGRPRPWIVIHPFGGDPHKWWPIDHAAVAAHQLAEKVGGTVFLIGGAPAPAPPRAPGPGTFVDLAGQLTLSELIALLATSDLVISTDSGPYHLAGNMGRPGIGLFRAARPEHAGRYRTIATAMATPDERCAGICDVEGCRFSPCREMGDLAPDGVVARALALLRAT